jgi:hypothetical protein
LLAKHAEAMRSCAPSRNESTSETNLLELRVGCRIYESFIPPSDFLTERSVAMQAMMHFLAQREFQADPNQPPTLVASATIAMSAATANRTAERRTWHILNIVRHC